jgi:glycosyltransferase involved in cell wall biosynthesis
MKVVLATPNYHQQRGNTVTVQRIAEKLKNIGVVTSIVSITESLHTDPLPQADLIHGFHAYRFYKFKERLGREIGSYVITMTGTDLNQDLFDSGKRKDVIKSVREAKAVHVFTEKAKKLLIAEVPEIASRVLVIPQGTTEFPASNSAKMKENGTFQFLLPAGIRQVKNIPFAIKALKKLHKEYPYTRLLIVGPIIETDEAEIVKELLAENKSWAEYIGQVPHSEMGGLYRHADAVLNTSHSEGQSTAIIEAMGAGIPVLVSANDGNLSLIAHGETGFVYHDEAEFLQYAQQLITQEKIRTALGERGQKYISVHHGNPGEAEALLELYKLALMEKES